MFFYWCDIELVESSEHGDALKGGGYPHVLEFCKSCGKSEDCLNCEWKPDEASEE